MSKHAFGTSVQDYFLDQVRKAYAERKERLYSIQSEREAKKYIADVKKKIVTAFDLPQEKCPLNAFVVDERRIGKATMKKIVYYSRPFYPVTGLLYIPDGAVKAPAVLNLCGHSDAGKGNDWYQTCAINLAAQGFVVLTIDPVGQGERRQYVDVTGKLKPGNSCHEHNMDGKRLHLVGENFCTTRAWDAIRGIDYLLTLPEVDPARIGVTGNSGGGTMSTLLNAVDDRLFMAAPSCYITTWLREVENEEVADFEQRPPDMFKYGIEMSDFVIAQAPRPTLILGQKYDFFDVRGTKESYEDARHIYSVLGAEDNVKLFIGPHHHGYSEPNRLAMYSFFNLHAFKKEEAPKENPRLKWLKPEETWCTPNGKVNSIKGSKYLREIVRDRADELIARRVPRSKEELRTILKEILQIGRIEVPYYRILRQCAITLENGRLLGVPRFGLETEAGRVMSVLKLYYNDFATTIPESEQALLHIPHADSDAETPFLRVKKDMALFAPERPSRKLIRKGIALYGLDVRGIGEVMPSGCHRVDTHFFDQYKFDYQYATWSIMLGKPYLGGKVRDIMCALELLKSCGVKNIILSAEGQGTVPAMLAAFLSDIPVETRLHHTPESWDSMLRKEYTRWPLSCMLPGILAVTDMPELRSMIPNLKYTVQDEPQEFVAEV